MKRVGLAVRAYSGPYLGGRGTATTPSSAPPISGLGERRRYMYN